MKIRIFFLDEFGKAFIPKSIRPKLRGNLLKAGITEIPYRLFGALFYVSLLITYLSYIVLINPYLIEKKASALVILTATFISWFTVQISIVGLFMLGVYYYLDLKIFGRTRNMEAVLADYLQLVAENLRGGMPFDRALWRAVKPEFGVLANEIRIVAKKVMTGQDVDKALEEFTRMYDSPMLNRSFDLIIQGIKGGAKMADLLDRVVKNLKETHALKADMSATGLSYVIFISFIVMFVAPGLYSLAYYLLIIIGNFIKKIGGTIAQSLNLPITFETVAMTPADFRIFSIAAIAVTAFFSSMIVSMILKGNLKEGVKYIPLITTVSVVMYFIYMVILSVLFGGFAAGV